MDSEKIIGQLMQRIELLERKVEYLERTQQNLPTRSKSELNEKMYKECYRAAKKLHEGNEGSFSSHAELIHEKTGMKFGTAKLTIMSAYSLLSGELYKSAISSKAAGLFFELIQKDYGAAGLKKAVLATRKHINHRRASNHKVELLENLCNRYEILL